MDHLLDFCKICRLCCLEVPRMRSIFGRKRKYPLEQLFTDVLRLEVHVDDGLPQQVCETCITTVTKFHETIESFRANDDMLRRQLGPINFVEVKEEEEGMIEERLDEAYGDEMRTNEDTGEEIYVEVQHGYEDGQEVVPEMDENDSEQQQEVPDDCDTDEDWIEEKPKIKTTKRTIQRNLKGQKDPKIGKAKRGRRKTVFDDPNRPRLNDFKCYICKSDSLGSAEALIAHLNSHTSQLPYTCSICVFETVVINSVSTLNVHKRMHENPHKCEYCDKRYSNRRNILLHVQLYHMGENAPCPSTCTYCGKVCPTKLSLKNHEKIHTKAVSCEFCGKIFVEKHKLRLHIQRKHEKNRKYECHLCNKKLNSLDAVQVHINIMHSDKEFSCKYCSRTYTSEMSLRYHEKKHEENPSYISTNNWKQYYTFVEGEEGIKDGVRLKKCGLCGAITKAIGPHLNMIHFPKEFRCEHCDMVFKRKGAYTAHVLEHEYGKAYSCPICGKEFSERKYLLLHLRTKKHRDHPMAQSLDWLDDVSAKVKVKAEAK